MNLDNYVIAQVGRTVGLHGDLKLHLLTDFPKQIRSGNVFESDRGTLEISDWNPTQRRVRFVGYTTPEAARKLTNARLYVSEKQTRETISLNPGEYFWFDIIGCHVVEKDNILGTVKEIERLPGTDYLDISTDASLIQSGLPGTFLLPYLPRYIQSVDLERKRIEVIGARDVLEAS